MKPAPAPSWLKGVLGRSDATHPAHHGLGRAGHLDLDGNPITERTYVLEDEPPPSLDERKRDIKSRTANLQALESARHRLITDHNERLSDLNDQIATEAGDLHTKRRELVAELESIGITSGDFT